MNSAATIRDILLDAHEAAVEARSVKFGLNLTEPDAAEWLRMVMIRRLCSETILTMRLAHVADMLAEQIDEDRRPVFGLQD